MRLESIPVIHNDPAAWVAENTRAVPAPRKGACDGCVFKQPGCFGCQYPQKSVASHTEAGCLASRRAGVDIVYADRILARV